MKKRLVEWFKTNKEEIKTSVIMFLLLFCFLNVLFNIILSTLCTDLTERVKDLEYANSEMEHDLGRQGIMINAYMEREELCKSGKDVGDDEYSIICVQK